MAEHEAALYDKVRLVAARYGCRLFRNNVGVFKTAQTQTFTRVGLGTGSSDLVGWRSITVDGQKVAQFVAIEVKTATGRVRKEQKAFLKRVDRDGGLAAVVRSVEDAEEIFKLTP